MIDETLDLNAVISRKHEREYATSYEIPHAKRKSLRETWITSKLIGMPLNTLVSFEFQATGRHCDVNVVRNICHKTRVFLRHSDLCSAILWSRFKQPNSNIEEVKLLLHIDNVADYIRFARHVENWQSGATVQVVNYSSDIPFKDKGNHNIFDIMFRMLSNETRDKNPTLLFERSSGIVGWMTFESIRTSWMKRLRQREDKFSEKEAAGVNYPSEDLVV